MGLSPSGWLKIVKGGEKRQEKKRRREREKNRKDKGKHQEKRFVMPVSERDGVRGRRPSNMNRLFPTEGFRGQKWALCDVPKSPSLILKAVFWLGSPSLLLVSAAALPLPVLRWSSTSLLVWKEAAGVKGTILQGGGMLLCLGDGKRAAN